jgi:hypothetical protein
MTSQHDNIGSQIKLRCLEMYEVSNIGFQTFCTYQDEERIKVVLTYVTAIWICPDSRPNE